VQAALDAIDDTKYFPPEAAPRNLAEGYRYLACFVHHGIERAFHEDPDFPAFRNALSMFNKSTIENSDAIYFYSPIDGSKNYRVTGRVEDCRHWQGSPRLDGAPVAPQYLIFEVATGPMAGDTGDLRELQPGYRTGFGTLDSSSLKVEADGTFELILGPEKPAGFEGNFICTRKPPSRKKPEAGDRYADYVSGRQLFYDWENEEPVHLSIECLDTAGGHPEPLTPEKAAAQSSSYGRDHSGADAFLARVLRRRAELQSDACP